MQTINKVLLLFFCFIFLTACNTNVEVIYHNSTQVIKPVQNTTIAIPEVIVLETNYSIIYDNKEISRIDFTNNTINIYNCGNKAYGMEVVDKVKTLILKNYEMNNVYINSTSLEYIGGCKDIILNVPGIKHIYLINITRTPQLNDSLNWFPEYNIMVI